MVNVGNYTSPMDPLGSKNKSSSKQKDPVGNYTRLAPTSELNAVNLLQLLIYFRPFIRAITQGTTDRGNHARKSYQDVDTKTNHQFEQGIQFDRLGNFTDDYGAIHSYSIEDCMHKFERQSIMYSYLKGWLEVSYWIWLVPVCLKYISTGVVWHHFLSNSNKLLEPTQGIPIIQIWKDFLYGDNSVDWCDLMFGYEVLSYSYGEPLLTSCPGQTFLWVVTGHIKLLSNFFGPFCCKIRGSQLGSTPNMTQFCDPFANPQNVNHSHMK